MTTIAHALVVGGGIDGLSACVALRRPGSRSTSSRTARSRACAASGSSSDDDGVDGLLNEFRVLMGEMREQITDHAVVYRPTEAVLVDRPWYRGRIALIGDAAHATSRHVGQGAATTVEDVTVLAEEVTGEGPVDAALERWMDCRWERVKTICDLSELIGRYEIEGVHDVDFLGLTPQAVTATAPPI